MIIHQVYELWFKQILHEPASAAGRARGRQGAGALHTVTRRIAKILKTIVGQLDVLETMTPRQFAVVPPASLARPAASSPTSSASSRRCSAAATSTLLDVPQLDRRAWPRREPPSVFDSLLRFLAATGYDVPPRRSSATRRSPAGRDPGSCRRCSRRSTTTTGPAAEVCEALVDIDEGIQEWRYRHVKMVERIIGAKPAPADRRRRDLVDLFHPAFPDLWEVRAQL